MAYFAQSTVLFERILGRITPVLPRFSATLVEPATGELLKRHELTLQGVFQQCSKGGAASLAHFLAARAIPGEGKQRLAEAGAALEAELTPLLEWMPVSYTHLEGGHRLAKNELPRLKYSPDRFHEFLA